MAAPFAPVGLPNSRNIWLLHDHWALTSKNKLHIKRKTDTVPGGRKGHYRCLCVFRCVFVWCGTYGWGCVKVNGCVLEWICMTSLSRLHLPPLTQQTADTWVYISLRRQRGMNAHTLFNQKLVCSLAPSPFFCSCEKASCYYYESNDGCSFLAQESGPAERASNAQKMKMSGKLSSFLWPTLTLLAICIWP